MGKVLIIDDEQALGTLLSHMVSHYGYRVEVAQTAQESLMLLRRNNYHLVLADLCLPDQPNPQVWLDTLVAHVKETSLILLSGLAPKDLMPYLQQAGVQQVLQKPFTLDEFRTVIEPFLGASA